MPPVGFEPTILVSERPKTHTLDRTATGIGIYIYMCLIMVETLQYKIIFKYREQTRSANHTTQEHVYVRNKNLQETMKMTEI
jgi:hypothetical protein